MNRFFATSARGLEPILANELVAIGAQFVEPGRGGVAFQGDMTLLYRANLMLRTAVRVLMPLAEGPVLNPDELYQLTRSLDWSEYLSPDRTLAVDCNLRDSNITHSQYAARRVKDAICDQFRDRTGRRPSVNTEMPTIPINLHIHRNHAVLSLDSSWISLHKRGYRPIQTRAPLNEALAAGLLLHLGFTGNEPLYDPMCGSGTFPIEAAWIATGRPPGLTRRWFGFFGWPQFDKSVWSAIRENARKQIRSNPEFAIAGSDLHHDASEMARENAKTAGVGHCITLMQKDLSATRPPPGPPGLIICNPPYGERLGEEEELEEVYGSLGEVVAGCWRGWRLAVFTSNHQLARAIRLPVVGTTPFFNGSLTCKLWVFRTP